MGHCEIQAGLDKPLAWSNGVLLMLLSPAVRPRWLDDLCLLNGLNQGIFNECRVMPIMNWLCKGEVGFGLLWEEPALNPHQPRSACCFSAFMLCLRHINMDCDSTRVDLALWPPSLSPQAYQYTSIRKSSWNLNFFLPEFLLRVLKFCVCVLKKAHTRTTQHICKTISCCDLIGALSGKIIPSLIFYECFYIFFF